MSLIARSCSTLAAVLGLLAVALSTGCIVVCTGDHDSQLTRVELGTNEDLHAIVALDHTTSNREYRYLAVGDAGTVVAWGQTFAEVFDVGDVNLRAAWNDGPSWWVVGDGGTVAVSDNLGATWNTIVLADGDLHAIESFHRRPIIVGDDVVVLRNADGLWVEPPKPEGGWGQLRGIAVGPTTVHVVGLGGVAWSTSDPTGEWIADPTGVDVDLFDAGYSSSGRLIAIGAQGTLLMHIGGDPGYWYPYMNDVTADLLDYDQDYVLARGGDVFEATYGGGLNHVDQFVGAEALSNDQSVAAVGPDGFATMIVETFFDCE
jgi:hypothetical protein